MAQVEIYKIKKTAPLQIREYSVFDYMRNGEKPNPLHYVREWGGEMSGTMPLTIPGKLMLDPPKGYNGGEIKNGDIAVVNGTPYFMDHESGAKFVEIDFDAAAVRDAVHVKYGWFVDIRGAEAISDTISYVCDDLGIPVGYLGEQSAGGIYNDRRPFLPGSFVGDHLCFLHPEFLIGDEARAFISLLAELTEAEHWTEIFDYLREQYPINHQDLETARERYAPELFLPEELRPLSKVIPVGADQLELDYLSAKVGSLNENQQNVFYAVVEAGWHCGSITEIINLTENLEHFDLEPAFTESQYGEFRLENDYDICEAAIRRLENSEDHSDRFLAKYITLLNRCADSETYGHHAAKDDGGAFTKYGYISQGRGLDERYRGVQDIPAAYRVAEPLAADTKPKAVMVSNTELPALLFQMHALGGDYMRDVKHNLKTLAEGGADFLVMIDDHTLSVTPADTVFRRDMPEHEALMMLSHAPDIRMFYMSVTDREDGRITGNLCEVELMALQNYIRSGNFHNTDPAEESRLTYIETLRWAVEANRTEVPAAKLLSQISETYMAQSHEPHPGRFRVAPEAARDIVAQNAASVFKFYPEPFAQMTPIDATKHGLWADSKSEFSVRHSDWEKLEKWAQRASGEMLRQTERGENKKSRDTEL